MVLSKEQIDLIDATPTKRIYRSIIADYDVNTAIAELIDNAIDAWRISRSGPDLEISVEIDLDQQKISITDNAGGVKESELKKLISPGESTLVGTEESIGIFGVGSKRAVVALAQLVRITTRYHNEKTFRLEYDDEWLRDPDWNLPYSRVDNIPPSKTIIELSNLRFKIENDHEGRLRNHLSATYAYFLKNNKMKINLNHEPLEGIFFDDNWAFPPEYEPVSLIKRLAPRYGKKKIRLEILAGLIRERGMVDDYGVYFYCNERLICKALRTAEVGFSSGLAGRPHHMMCLARILVRLNGPSEDMPWTSNKSAIHYNHHIYRAIRDDIIQTVKTYTQLSKKLHSVFEERVKPHESGEIKEIRLEKDESIKPSKLPIIPRRSRQDFKTMVLELNKKIGEEKPWTRGLYEAIIAERIIASQQALKQRNRISLIILDSTLEIAFKDFLAFEIEQPLGDRKLAELFRNRVSVHNEVNNHLNLGENLLKRINYFYKLRCELIHRKVNVAIPEDEIEQFRSIVITILDEAFGIQFPED